MPKQSLVADIAEIDLELCPAGTRRGYRIRYRTNGRITSGSVYVPYSTSARATELPLLTWAHCFVGLDHHSAPSRRGLPGVERQHLSFWLAHGFAVAAADYKGLDGHGISPFPQSEEIAHDVLGICSAAEELGEGIGGAVIAGGFCQGAVAVSHVSALASERDIAVDYRGSVSLAPPDYLSYFARVTRDADFAADALVLYLLAGVRAGDDSLRPAEFLTPKGIELLEAAAVISVPEMRKLMAACTVGDLGIHNVTQRSPVAAALERAVRVPTMNASPYFLATIEADPLTPRAGIRRHLDAIPEQGADLTFRSYPGQHMDILELSALDVVEWAISHVRPRTSRTYARSR